MLVDDYESVIEIASILDLSEKTSSEDMGHQPKLWDSVVKMYGDADTTEYWQTTETPKKQTKKKLRVENYGTQSNPLGRCECTNHFTSSPNKSKSPRPKSKERRKENTTCSHSPRPQWQNSKYEPSIQFSSPEDTKLNECKCPKKHMSQKKRPNGFYNEDKSNQYSQSKFPKRGKEFDDNQSPHSRRKQKSHYTSTNTHRVVKDNADLSEGFKTYRRRQFKENQHYQIDIKKNGKTRDYIKDDKNNKQENKSDCQCPTIPRNESKRSSDETYKRVKFMTGFFADGNCDEGPCIEAAEQKNKEFKCKCNKRRFTATECTNESCKLKPNQPFEIITQNELDAKNKNDKKILEQFTCLCRKYSNKFYRVKTIFVPKNTILHVKRKRQEIKEVEKHELKDVKNVPRHKIHEKVNIKDIEKEDSKDVQIVPRHKIPEYVIIKEPIKKEKTNFKRKFICLCRKYSHKVKSHVVHGVEYYIPDHKICDTGICREAAKIKKQDFICKCVPVITECSDETCGVDPVNLVTKHITEPKVVIFKPKNLQTEIKTKDKKQETNGEFKSIRTKNELIQKTVPETLKSERKSQDDNCFCTIINATDQTGEPFFEVDVDSVNMCVLNEDEIKNKVKTLGKKKIRCLCPSYFRQLEFTPRKVCKSGVCRKSLKNKKTFYKCKCQKDLSCTDLTCSNNPIPIATGQTDPLFAVNLDSNTMCILNSKEITREVIQHEKPFCLEGKCKNAYKEKDFKCKCLHRKPKHDLITCDNLTCSQCRCQRKTLRGSFDTKNIWDMTSKINSNNSQVKCEGRGTFNSRSIRDIPKKIYCACSRIKNRSENWLCEGMEEKQRRRLQTDSIHRRDGLRISVRKKAICKECGDPFYPEIIEKPEDNCICCDCQTGSMCTCKALCRNRFKSFICDSLSTLLKRNRHTGKIKRYRREPVAISYDRKEENIPVEDTMKINHDDTHECQCKKRLKKRKKKLRRKMKKRKQKQIKRAARNIDKQFLERMKNNDKSRKKRHKIMNKFEKKEVKKLREEIGTKETNCFFDIVMGILRAAGTLAIAIIFMIIALVRDPKGSYWYVKKKWKDPSGTWYDIKIWFKQAWEVRKLRMQTTIAGSQTLTILNDTVQNAPWYHALAPKGKTKQEQKLKLQERKAVAKRVRKRDNEAIFGCRHMILTTLRKRPCLWCYHLFPDLYPQCLSLMACWRDLMNVLMFVLAIFVWTPCLIACELCRAFCCCLLCTH